MVHSTNTSHSATFLLGTGLLMFLFFCAPMHAQSSQGFKSTSAYQINASVQSPNVVNQYSAYKSTIYQPFSESAPTSDNPSGGSSGINGRRNATIGIPSWGDTMSEPLPIGDVAPLFWLAAAMIAMIAIRQRKKQLQTTTQTSNNNSNNDTNEMTPTQHTSKSLRKLLMLALLLCFVGEASADGTDTTLNKKQNAVAAATKTIYFRPSTVCIDGGYTYTGGSGSNIAWVRYGSSNRRYFIVEKPSNSSTPTYHAFTKTQEILPNGTTAAKATKSRFLSATLSTTSSFSCYRVYNLTTSEDNAKKIDITQAGSNSTISGQVQNCIPNNEWWLGNGAHGQTWTSKLISVAEMGDKNLVAIREGYWAGGDESSSTKKGYYFGYYLENDAHIYFENKNDWSAPTFLRGKDIYAYSHAMTKIDSTNLYYCKLAAPTSDVESGIAYTDYAFISKATTKGYDVNNEDVLLWKRWPHATDNATDLAFSSKDNNSFDKLRKKSGYSYTGALSNKLSGTYNLFIPGSANDAAPTQVSLTDQKSLNQEHTFIVETGGKINMYVHALDYYTNIVSNSPRTDITGTRNENVVYTSTVWLSAHPENGYDFIGWYEKDNSGNLTRLSTASQYHYEVERTNRTIVAKFADKKKFRMQIFENKSDLNIYDKDDWTDSNQGGTLTIQYTKTDGTTYTETIDAVERSKDDIHPEKTLTITATPKDGYTFVGFWNNNKGQIFGQNPWSMTPKDQDEPVTARFAKTFTQKVNAYTYNTETDVFDAKGTNGGSVSIVYPKIAYTKEGCEKDTATTTGEWSDNVLAEKTTMTITASAADGYKFLGWYSTAGEPIDWMNQEGAKVSYTANAAYTIVARFHKPFSQAFDVQTEISGQYQNSTTGGTATISYNNTTTDLSNVTSTIPFEQGTMVTLNATPEDGYRFVGWFQNDGTCWTENPYTYCAEGARTLHARFARNDVQLVVSVMNYNTDYADFVEYPHDNNTVTIANGGNTTTVTSSTSAVVNYGSQVTLTATPDGHETEGYDFIGWYQNNQRISTNPTYTFTITDHSAISAHFAPKQCHKVILYHTCGGQYQVKYAREELFDEEGSYYIANSLYNKDTTIYVPYEAKLAVIESTAKPTIGYKYTGYYRITKVTDAPVDGVYTIKPTKTAGGEENTPEVFVEFIRTEDQIVYLDLTAPNAREDWKNRTQYFINVRNIARKAQAGGVTAANIELTKVKDGLYSGTIPGNIYTDVTFYYEDKEGDFKRVSTTPQVIPATRNNCFILKGVYSSTDGWIDGWTTLDTENGDYRLIYREQTVVDKNTIRVDYEFNEGDRIKKITSGTKTDIVSLHIYNKVSNDGVNGINNPEVILQQWSDNKDAWVDVERYMVFGPLRSNNAGVIKMPNRKNTANEVVRVDLGINNIMTDKTDNGCGVWNFVIEQDGTTARLLVDETRRYEGNYYIRTTNADGQYNNFTHPNNVMTYSEYAKKNSDFSHYFVRYIDIYEDGTQTATAGKHPVVKFTIANEHAMFLCKEFLIDNNRFTDDEYGNDIFVLDKGGAPNLPVDATVRFGWDIITNRLTRAYIADTEFKNNEYLIVEGNTIGDVSGEKAYFDEIGDHFYQIDLNAKVPSYIKVKAKMNGNYQYFMGSENATDQLIGGQANGSYPLRLLYDFKNDRFITICELAGTINGNINLETSVMIMREHNDAPKQLTFANNDASITATPNVPNTGQDQYTKPAYAVMTFLEDKLLDNNVSHHEKMFYWVSFPFRIKIEDVFGLGDYGQYWIMQYYDGAQRALQGLAQTNWKYITNTETILEPNKGYIICLNYNQILQDQLFTSHGAGEFGNSKLSLYFPSYDMISPADIKNQANVTVTLAEHPRGEKVAWNHWNWHLIGVPSFATPGFESKQDDIPFLYQYWHPGDAYAAVTPNDVTFHAMHSFMVQYAGNITWKSVVNATPKSLAAKKDADADKKIMLRLELQQAGSTIDKTYVQLRDDKGTLGFDMSLDLTKIINAGANIYSIVDNHEMAGNAVPKEESVIPLGVVITAAGEYTFAMPNGTEGMVVELIDYEAGTSTNLLVMDYTVTLPKGTNNTRFALRMKPNKVATSVDNIGNEADGDKVRKLLIDGVLYLQQGTNTYDAQGKHVK